MQDTSLIEQTIQKAMRFKPKFKIILEPFIGTRPTTCQNLLCPTRKIDIGDMSIGIYRPGKSTKCIGRLSAHLQCLGKYLQEKIPGFK